MKRLFLFILIALASGVSAQNNDYIVSIDGIGSIKLGMTQKEVEELLNKKIPLTNPWDSTSGSTQDSAKVKYKSINLDLDFERKYKGSDSFEMVVIGIASNSHLCKTKSGLGIGTDKLKIIAAYEDNVLIVQPGYENYYYTEKSNTKSTITVQRESDNHVINFYLNYRKVVGFEVKINFNDLW